MRTNVSDFRKMVAIRNISEILPDEPMPNQLDKEKLFNNAVREYILLGVVVLLVMVVSHAALTRYRRRDPPPPPPRLRSPPLPPPDDEAIVDTIALWVCTLSLSTSLAALLLLLVSILSSDSALTLLSDTLMLGLWNAVFLLSNLLLFAALPFVYLFTEAEGFPGTRKGLGGKLLEAGVVLLLLVALVLGVSMVLSCLLHQRSIEAWGGRYLPLLQSVTSHVGVLLLLLCTPVGLGRLFSRLVGLMRGGGAPHDGWGGAPGGLDDPHAICLEEAAIWRQLRALGYAEDEQQFLQRVPLQDTAQDTRHPDTIRRNLNGPDMSGTRPVVPHPQDTFLHPQGILLHPQDILPYPQGIHPHPQDILPHPQDVIPHPQDVLPPHAGSPQYIEPPSSPPPWGVPQQSPASPRRSARRRRKRQLFRGNLGGVRGDEGVGGVLDGVGDVVSNVGEDVGAGEASGGGENEGDFMMKWDHGEDPQLAAVLRDRDLKCCDPQLAAVLREKDLLFCDPQLAGLRDRDLKCCDPQLAAVLREKNSMYCEGDEGEAVKWADDDGGREGGGWPLRVGSVGSFFRSCSFSSLLSSVSSAPVSSVSRSFPGSLLPFQETDARNQTNFNPTQKSRRFQPDENVNFLPTFPISLKNVDKFSVKRENNSPIKDRGPFDKNLFSFNEQSSSSSNQKTLSSLTSNVGSSSGPSSPIARSSKSSLPSITSLVDNKTIVPKTCQPLDPVVGDSHGGRYSPNTHELRPPLRHRKHQSPSPPSFTVASFARPGQFPRPLRPHGEEQASPTEGQPPSGGYEEPLGCLLSRLSAVQAAKIRLELSSRRGLVRRCVVYPLGVVVLVGVTGVVVLLVGVNFLQLISGFKSLPHALEDGGDSAGPQVAVLVAALGPLGAAVEAAVVLYLAAAALVGCYSLPPMAGVTPVRGDTPTTHLIINCVLLLVMATALPLLAATLGLTSHALVGLWGCVGWLGNMWVVLTYNATFAAAAVACLLQQFSAAVRSELRARLEAEGAALLRRCAGGGAPGLLGRLREAAVHRLVAAFVPGGGRHR